MHQSGRDSEELGRVKDKTKSPKNVLKQKMTSKEGQERSRTRKGWVQSKHALYFLPQGGN